MTKVETTGMHDGTDERFGVLEVARSGLSDLGRAPSLVRGAGLIGISRVLNHLSVGRLVEHHARWHGQRVALQFEDRVYSYNQLNAEANRYAQVLNRSGIAGGDTVALLMDNRPETLFAAIAIVKLGAAAAMCNTKQRGDVLAHSLSLVAPAAILVGDELTEAFDALRGDIGFQSADRVWQVRDQAQTTESAYRDLLVEAQSRSADNPAETAAVDQSSPAFYIFTSGTTGMPKASVMSHTRWLRAGAGLGLAGMGLRADDVLYCPLPLYHNNALTVSWGATLCAGATFVLARKFSVSGFWPDVRRHQATAFCYIGELCRYLAEQEPDSRDRDHVVRVAIGNGLRPEIWDEFKARFGIDRICEFYGASEGNLVFVNGFNMDRTAGFCPLSFAVVDYDAVTEAPVTDADGGMQRVAKGGVGLLLTKITNMAPYEGYTDDDASESKIYRNVFKNGDAWFDTGDLVRDQGMRHIAFVDRLGDTFRWKGENVATTEVEQALDNYPGISESVAYGVEVPGADGRAGMAAITPEDGIDWARLAGHLQNALPPYAVPVFIRVRSGAQEVTSTFKFRKVELKKEAYTPPDDEPVYFLPAKATAYESLTSELRARIDSGDIRL